MPPDLEYTSVKLSQSNSCPHKLHYCWLKHALKFFYISLEDDLYFWQTSAHLKLPDGPTPTINSNCNDILLNDWPLFDALVAHAYADLDWATCPKTWWFFGRICLQLAGRTIAYKYCFQQTVSGSKTEAEFMAACNTDKMIFYICSIWYGTRDITKETYAVSIDQFRPSSMHASYRIVVSWGVTSNEVITSPQSKNLLLHEF